MDGDKRKRVEFIEEEEDRNSTYTRRKKELINEARDLSVLCGVDSCMLITNAPGNSNKDQVDLVWSSNSNNVGDLINKHKEQSGKKKVIFDKLPTWNSKLESMDEPELRDLASNLETKINALKIRREEMMKIKRSKMMMETKINDSLCPSPNPQSNDDCDLQSSSMVEPNAEAIVTNEKETAMNTLTDLQPEVLYDPSNPFINYDSG